MAIDDRAIEADEHARERKIDAAAWGILLVWIGVALLADVGWGVGLLGVGVITLAAQAWRRHVHLKVDHLSVIIGALFAVVGVWNLFALRVDLVPVLLIAAGIGLLSSAWRTRSASRAAPVDAPAHRRGVTRP